MKAMLTESKKFIKTGLNVNLISKHFKKHHHKNGDAFKSALIKLLKR